MFVNRQGTGTGSTDLYNRTFGVDGNFRLWDHLIINSYFAATDEPNVRGDRKAGRVQMAWRDPVWNVSGFLKHVGDAFNPGVGFVRRRAMQQAFATVGAHSRPRMPVILELNPYADVDFITNLDGMLETREFTAGFGITFMDGSSLRLEYTDQFERLTNPDVITGIELPSGDYPFRFGSTTFRSSGARALAGTVSVSRGGFFDGDRTSVFGSVTLRPNHHLNIGFTAQHNDITLADSSVTADVFGGRIRYAYSTKVFASAFVQYNAASDELVTNIRFNFIHAPLSDVFLVFTERRDLENSVLLDRVLTAKVTKLLAF